MTVNRLIVCRPGVHPIALWVHPITLWLPPIALWLIDTRVDSPLTDTTRASARDTGRVRTHQGDGAYVRFNGHPPRAIDGT